MFSADYECLPAFKNRTKLPENAQNPPANLQFQYAVQHTQYKNNRGLYPKAQAPK